MDKQIIIVSLPRSGSSLTSRILSCLGVDFGKNLQKPDKMNPEGYMEDLEFKSINKMLKTNSESYQILEGNMRAFLKKRKGIVGLKNPMACYTLQHWLPLMSNPMIIHLSRNHRDVEMSFKKYPVFDKNYHEVLLEWSEAKYKLLSLTGAYLRLRLEYEELIAYPKQEIKRIAEFVGVDYNEKCLKLIRTNENTKN